MRKSEIGCPPGYLLGQGAWKMNLLATFGAGDDVCELWNVDARMMLRFKDGNWSKTNITPEDAHICGALEGLRAMMFDGWDGRIVRTQDDLPTISKADFDNVKKAFESADAEIEQLKKQIEAMQPPLPVDPNASEMPPKFDGFIYVNDPAIHEFMQKKISEEKEDGK